MKLKFYMDVYHGWQPQFASATVTPCIEKPANVKRISFEVEVPDYILNPVDFHIQETSVAKEAK